MDISEIVREVRQEAQSTPTEEWAKLSSQVVDDEAYAAYVMDMVSATFALGVMMSVDPRIGVTIKSLCLMSLEVGIKIGRQEVMDSFLPKEIGE